MTVYGRDPTCNDEVYIANKHNRANITHAFYYDASLAVYSINLIGAALPIELLPATPAVGDIVYFGIDTTLANSGPFCSLVFDIATAQTGITGITWEFWNGAWAALTNVQDNTDADGEMTGVAFDTTGVNSVHWTQPTAWLTTAINGITGYWVRARVTVVPGASTPPTQQNRDIYSVVWAYAEIQADDIGGDIPALIQMKLYNESNQTGYLYSFDQVTVGARSVDRGEDFRAYLPISDRQLPNGVTSFVDVADSAFANGLSASTGRYVFYNPAAARTIANEFYFGIAYPYCQQYIGKYRVYLRCLQTAGAIGDVGARIVVSNAGTGVFIGTDFVGDTVYTEILNRTTTLDLGVIDIPNMPLLESDNMNAVYLIVQLSNDFAGAMTFYMYDLILIPVDEWSATFDEYIATVGGSPPAPIYSLLVYLDIDSITAPKRDLAAIVRATATDNAVTMYNRNSLGSAIVQSNKRQRLWFHFAWADSAGGQTLPRFSVIETTASIQMYGARRYLSMRGER